MDSLSKSIGKLFTYMGGALGAGFAVAATMAEPGWQSLSGGAAGFFIAVAGIGGIIWATSHQRVKRVYLQRREQKMLAVARSKMGRVTDVELAAETRYPLEECREFLKHMTETGSAEMNIGSDGTMVYLFPGFLSDSEKAAAKGVSQWTPPSEAKRKAMGPLSSAGDDDESSTSSPPPLQTE